MHILLGSFCSPCTVSSCTQLNQTIPIKISDRDRKGRNKRGHRVRISPPLGQRSSQQTPVSILDLNVPKPPGLKEDMNGDWFGPGNC
jgi:hypothetical protein